MTLTYQIQGNCYLPPLPLSPSSSWTPFFPPLSFSEAGGERLIKAYGYLIQSNINISSTYELSQLKKMSYV